MIFRKIFQFGRFRYDGSNSMWQFSFALAKSVCSIFVRTLWEELHPTQATLKIFWSYSKYETRKKLCESRNELKNSFICKFDLLLTNLEFSILFLASSLPFSVQAGLALRKDELLQAWTPSAPVTQAEIQSWAQTTEMRHAILKASNMEWVEADVDADPDTAHFCSMRHAQCIWGV